jgi:glyoxylase-like metal-dependent hydrolase (beta-lactamase superfamily II)
VVTRREFHAISVQSVLAMLSARALGGEHDPRTREAAPGHPATRPAANRRGPIPGKPVYRMYPLRNGTCAVTDRHAFVGGTTDKAYEYELYVWLVLGGPKPILVDAGLVHVDVMNRGAAKVLAKPIVQAPEESIPYQLNHFGLAPEDIGHILVTHMHYDHVDGLETFPNATYHIGRKEFEGATANEWRGSWCDARILDYLCNKARDQVDLVDDGEEVLPGIKALWTGGHTPGCMAYQINTEYGRAVHTGDVVSLQLNFDRGVPAGVYTSVDEGRAAIKRIAAEADVVLPSHDPGNIYKWPPRPKGSKRYTVRALKCGECQVRDFITFAGCDSEATRTFFLYVWLVEGGERPILVETGPNPKYIDDFNRSTAKYIPGGIQQKPEEQTLPLLKAQGVDPADVRLVIATHLHADHYDYFDAFPNAQLVVNRHGFLSQIRHVRPNVMQALAKRWPDALRLVEAEEIVPGIRTVPLGCHSPGSQGVVIDTIFGPVMMTGDVAYLYENVETDRHIACPDAAECEAAITTIRRTTDLVLPAHDPRVLDRWPGGKIGFKA